MLYYYFCGTLWFRQRRLFWWSQGWILVRANSHFAPVRNLLSYSCHEPQMDHFWSSRTDDFLRAKWEDGDLPFPSAPRTRIHDPTRNNHFLTILPRHLLRCDTSCRFSTSNPLDHYGSTPETQEQKRPTRPLCLYRRPPNHTSGVLIFFNPCAL